MVYLVAADRLVAVPRELPSPRSSVAALAALLEGASDTESTLGVTTALSSEALGSVRMGGGVVQVEVVADLDAGVLDPSLAFGQVVLTLTELDPVLTVAFTRNGSPLAVRLPDGSSTEGAVGRDDFVALLAD